MSSNHFIACQYIYRVIIKPANLPIGRNSPHFSKRGSLDKWEIGEDSSWWQVTLSTESSSARVCIPFQVRTNLIIPSLHTLSPPHSTSSYLERGENAGGRVSRECPGMGGASVFGQLRVSLASGRGQMETQKCVRRNYRGHVAWWKQKSQFEDKKGSWKLAGRK